MKQLVWLTPFLVSLGACTDADPSVPLVEPPFQPSPYQPPVDPTVTSDAGSSCPSPIVGPPRSPLSSTVNPDDHALRLTFSYDGVNVDLALTTRNIEPYAPPGFPFLAGANSGAWVELRDEDSGILAQAVVYDPFGVIVEAPPPPGDPGGFMNSRRCPTQATFYADLPNYPAGREVRVYADPLAAELATEGARLMARFEL